MHGSPSPTGSLRSIGGGDSGAVDMKVEAVDDGDGEELRESDALMLGHRRKRRKGVRSGSLMMAKLDYSERDTKCT